jgi:hypothetical protein
VSDYGPVIRRALLTTGEQSIESVAAYLPSNFIVRELLGSTPQRRRYAIEGVDQAGWTLDGYVIPRLASGLIFAREIDL